MDKNYFFSKKIDNDAYLIYNSTIHLPAIFNKQGKSYLELISKNKNIDECLKSIKLSEHEQFREFYDNIEDIGFLAMSNATNYDEYVEKMPIAEKKRFYFHLTDRCNLNCNYCYNVEKRKNFNDLSIEDWKKIIDKIASDLGTITITGGEPFLYKDFDILLEYLRKKRNDIRIECISNGNIDYSKNEKFVTIFKLLDKITISCDNILNDDQNRKGFCIDLFKKNIDWINEHGFENKTCINSVIARNKLDEVKKVKEFTKSRNLKFSYALRLPNKNSDKKYLPTINEYKDIILNRQLTTDDLILKDKIPLTLKCSAAGSTISIDSQGNCFPCQNFHYPEFNMGNLLHSDFTAILSSNIAQKIRKHHVLKIEKCNKCNLKFVCTGGCIADIYKLYGDITKHPKILCSYYKIGSINRLINAEYEED